MTTPAKPATPALAPATLDPRFGPYGDPTIGILFGGSGVGKSTSLLFSFASESTVFLAMPGALKSSVDTVGWSPRPAKREYPVGTLYDVANFLRALVGKSNHGVLTIVVDDLSVLLTNTMAAIEANPPRTKKNEVDTFKVWDMLGDSWADVVSLARTAGVHVWFNGHVRPPGADKEGNFWPGGVQTPSQKLTAKTPYLADCIWRAIPLDTSAVKLGGWKHAAECYNGDQTWTEKDRHGYDGVFPLNPGAALRVAGYQLPRPKGLEWIDAVAASVAQGILSGTPRDEVCREIAKKLADSGKFDRRHIAWAVFREGTDTATFRAMREDRWKKLGI